MSIQSQVTKYLTKYPDNNCKQTQNYFCEISPGYIKKLFYKNKRVTKKVTQKVTELPNIDDTRITMDMVEKLIVKGKTSIPLLRVMTDFLKVKSQDHSELQEIDLDIFYKKAMEE